MAREREREADQSSTRSRSRTRDRDNDANSRNRKASGQRVAINLDPKSYEQYGLWGDGEDVLITDVWAAPFNYGGKMRDDGKPQTTLAIFTEYLDEATDETHVEPVSYGDLKHYAPGLSPTEFDYAGGDENTWARIANGDEQITDEMRGPYILPVPQSFDDDGNPIYRRKTGTRGSNGDFYIQQAIECGKAAGVKIAFDPEDPNLRNLLVGVRGRIAKLSNTLRKGGGGDGFAGDKSKPLVLEEIYERIKLDDRSGGSKKRSAKSEDAEEQENRATRTRSRREEPEEDEAEPETKPARRGKKGAPSGPTADFLSDFAEKVEAFLSESPGKKIDRTKLTRLTSEYETREEADWVIGLATEDSDEVMEFWQNCELFDYSSRTNTVSL